jgi:hypothetical protein
VSDGGVHEPHSHLYAFWEMAKGRRGSLLTEKRGVFLLTFPRISGYPFFRLRVTGVRNGTGNPGFTGDPRNPNPGPDPGPVNGSGYPGGKRSGPVRGTGTRSVRGPNGGNVFTGGTRGFTGGGKKTGLPGVNPRLNPPGV